VRQRRKPQVWQSYDAVRGQARTCRPLSTSIKNRDEAIMLVEPPLECRVLGGHAVMVKLQLGMCIWVDGGGHQLSAEVKLPLSSQFLDGRSQTRQ
jgi:hypothetical protein